MARAPSAAADMIHVIKKSISDFSWMGFLFLIHLHLMSHERGCRGQLDRAEQNQGHAYGYHWQIYTGPFEGL